jgi:hypothetical protein
MGITTEKHRRSIQLSDALLPSESTLYATLIGTTPLLMHKPNLLQVSDEVKSTKKEVPLPHVEAEAAAYRDVNGGLILPYENIKRSTLEGGRKIKDPSGAARSNAFRVLSAALGSSDVQGFPLIDPDTGEVIVDFVVDSRRVTIGKAAIMRSRPRFDSWAVKLVMSFDSNLVNAELVGNALMVAGQRIGVGDFRPEKGGGSFGKFTVADLEVQD